MQQQINIVWDAQARDRFWAKVDIRGPKECWPWLGTKFVKKPYGKFCIRDTNLRAHRVAFFLANGHWPEPVGRHTCDNMWCCNPAHISEGTHAQNVADKVQRGRQAKGSRNGQAKLRERDVQLIRVLILEGFGVTEIARRYRVARSTIVFIRERKTWAHVPDLKLVEIGASD